MGEDTKLLQAIADKLDILIGYEDKADDEVPEYIRRFAMYYHDMLHIRVAYEEKGLPVPSFIADQVEYCHDRMELILAHENNQGGAFYKNRQELYAADDVANRYHRKERK